MEHHFAAFTHPPLPAPAQPQPQPQPQPPAYPPFPAQHEHDQHPHPHQQHALQHTHLPLPYSTSTFPSTLARPQEDRYAGQLQTYDPYTPGSHHPHPHPHPQHHPHQHQHQSQHDQSQANFDWYMATAHQQQQPLHATDYQHQQQPQINHPSLSSFFTAPAPSSALPQPPFLHESTHGHRTRAADTSVDSYTSTLVSEPYGPDTTNGTDPAKQSQSNGAAAAAAAAAAATQLQSLASASASSHSRARKASCPSSHPPASAAAPTTSSDAPSSVPAPSSSTASDSTPAKAATTTTTGPLDLTALGTPTPAKNGRPAYISPFNKHLGRNRACAACRDRKLKCDGAKPVCSQCQRAWEARRRGKKGAGLPFADELANCPPPPCVYMNLPPTRSASGSSAAKNKAADDVTMGNGSADHDGSADGAADMSDGNEDYDASSACPNKSGRKSSAAEGDGGAAAATAAAGEAGEGGPRAGKNCTKIGALPGSLAGAAAKSKQRSVKRDAEIMKLEKENAELRKRLEMLVLSTQATDAQPVSARSSHAEQGIVADWGLSSSAAAGQRPHTGSFSAPSAGGPLAQHAGGGPHSETRTSPASSAHLPAAGLLSSTSPISPATAPFVSLAQHFAAMNGAADQSRVVAAAAAEAANALGADASRSMSASGSGLDGLGAMGSNGAGSFLALSANSSQQQQQQMGTDGGLPHFVGAGSLEVPPGMDGGAGAGTAAGTAASSSSTTMYSVPMPAFTGGPNASIVDAPLLEIGSSVTGLSPSSDGFAGPLSANANANASVGGMGPSPVLPAHLSAGVGTLEGAMAAAAALGGPADASLPMPTPQLYRQTNVTFTGWPADFPPVPIFDQLIEVYFKYIASMFPILHRGRFYSRLTLGPLHKRFPHLSLLHAMFALAYTIVPELDSATPSPTIYAKGALNGKGVSRGTCAQFHAERAKMIIQRGTYEGQNVYEICQATTLMAIYKYANGELIDAWMLSASCLRVAVPLGLSRLEPESTVDAKEREREREREMQSEEGGGGAAGAGAADAGAAGSADGDAQHGGAESGSGAGTGAGARPGAGAGGGGPNTASAQSSTQQPQPQAHEPYTTILARKPIHIMRLSIMPPPRDWIDEEERRRTFWIAFISDRNASSATLWSPSLGEESVKTELPIADLRTYWNADASTKQTLERRQTLASYDLFTDSHGDSFQLQVKASILYSRCATYVGRMNDFVSVDEYVTPEFHKLNLDIQHLLQTIPAHMQDILQPCLVSGTTDGKLVLAHILPQSATLVLNQPLAELSADAAARCRVAITNVLRILELLASAGANLVHLPPVWSYLVANVGRALIRRWKDMRKNAPPELLLTSEGTIGEPIHAAEAALRKEIDLVFFALCRYGQRWPLGMRQAQVMARLMGIEMDPALCTHGLFFEDDITEVHQ